MAKTLTHKQQLKAALKKYAKVKANPSASDVIQSAKLSVAAVELKALLWDLKDNLEVRENDND